jgi:hypothetical protein
MNIGFINNKGLNKISKKIVLFTMAASCLVLPLTGCSSKTNNEDKLAEEQYMEYNQGNVPATEYLMISQEANDGDVVTFEPGKQLVYVRVTYPNCDITPSVGGLRVPEGYSIYFIEPVIKHNTENDSVSETIGYDAWFINTQEVEVTAVFDAYHGSYSFNTFGTPKEYENIKRY